MSLLLVVAVALFGRAKEKEKFGGGFSIEVSASEEELAEAVYEVAGDGIIQGSKEYEKDPYVSGASPVEFSPLFPKLTEPGRTFYKERIDAIAPRNFDASAASGTLAVRYVVRQKDAGRCILRIDAVYVESEHRFIHASNGTVESSEYRDIQDHVDALQLKKKQAVEGERKRQEELARQTLQQNRDAESASLVETEPSGQTLGQHVQDLRNRLERVVKAPGTSLKAAPYHSAANLRTLPSGTEVVILAVSPYWFGVETPEGQHGWIHRDDLEPLP